MQKKLHKKINLEFIDENFKIDEEKKTVKCTLKYSPNIKKFAETYGRPSVKILDSAPKMCKGLKEAFEKNLFVTTGVAKCSEEEVFDVETGMKIASFRARARAEKKYNNMLFAYFRLMMDTADRIDKALAQSDIAILRNNKIAESIFEE